MSTSLHLIADPLCGWCFGATPLVEASRKIEDLPIKLHLGGLFTAPNAKVVDTAMIQFIMSHHERITKLTGQTPGPALTNLLDSGDALFDSTPPIKACLAANLAGGDDLSFYQVLIKAHFMDGLRIVEEETLCLIADQCGLSAEKFEQVYLGLSEELVAQHINDSRHLLQSIGGQGFPTFALEQNGQIQMLNHQSVFNNPEAWQQALQELLIAETAH